MNIDNQRTPSVNSEHSENKKPCIACKELIHADAKLCPYCRTSQSAELLKYATDILKWIAATTAVVSLVVGVVRINSLFYNWREKQEAVTELVEAAKIQAESGDYSNSWHLMNEALELKPSSKLARQSQVDLSLDWLRTLKPIMRFDKSEEEIINQILPILARGAASSDKKVAADVHAHIGWAYVLLAEARRKFLDVDKSFEKALKLDSDNAYANVMWGYWVLSTYNNNDYQVGKPEKAIAHFSSAVETGKDLKFVRLLQILALTRLRELNANLEAFKIADRMRAKDETLDMRLKYRFIELFSDYFGYRRQYAKHDHNYIMTKLPPNDLLETFNWLHEEIENKDVPGYQDFERYRYTVAHLTASAGDTESALKILEELLPQLRSASVYRNPVKKDISTLQKVITDSNK